MWPVLWNEATGSQVAGSSSNRLESAFESVFGNASRAAGGWGGVPMAMWQDDDYLYIEAELPGVSEQHLELTIHQGQLSLRCERKADSGRSYLYNSRWYGQFERVIRLPDGVAWDDAEATTRDGVLTIKLTKRPEDKPKRIALKAK